jgi:hypothetical protein
MLLVILYLSYIDLERSNQGHTIFNSLHLGNGACLACTVVAILIMYRKSYEAMLLVIFDLIYDDLQKLNC